MPETRTITGKRLANDFSVKTRQGEASRLRAKLSDNRREELREFSDAITTDMEDLRILSRSVKDDMVIGEETYLNRFDRETRRGRNQSRFTHLPESGEIDPDSVDAHCEVGVTQGLSRKAINLAAAFFYRTMIEDHDRTYIPRVRGDRPDEAKVLETMVTAYVDHQFRSGDYRSAMRSISLTAPTHGNGILRYEASKVVRFRKNGKVYEEQVASEVTAQFTPWNPLHVQVSNPSRMGAKDQAIVWWETPQMDIFRLLRQEAIWDFEITRDEGKSADIDINRDVVRRVGGKFNNLDSIRMALKDQEPPETSSHDPVDQVNHEMDNSIDRPERVVSHADVFPMVEAEGVINMARYVEEGKFKPWMAEYFGVETPRKFSPSNEKDMIEFGIYLSMIPVWELSYIVDSTPHGEASDSHGDMTLIRFEDSQSLDARHSMYSYPLGDNDGAFWALSIPEIGRALEESADMLRNTQLWADYRRTHPNYIVNTAVLVKKSVDTLRRMIHGVRQIIFFEGGRGLNVNDVAKRVDVDIDTEISPRIAELEKGFQEVVGVATVGGGFASVTETKAEFTANESKAESMLVFILYGWIAEQERLIRSIIQDGIHMHGPEQFVAICARLAGIADVPKEALQIIESSDGLENEFDFPHPLTFGLDPAVMASLIERGANIFADVSNRPKLATAFYKFVGLPQASDYVLVPEESFEPKAEEMQMRGSNYIKPKATDDHQLHMLEHTDRLNQLGALNGEASDEDRAELEHLAQHMERHMTLFRLQKAAEAEQAALSAGPGAAGAARPSEGPGPVGGLTPNDGPTRASIVARDANNGAGPQVRNAI